MQDFTKQITNSFSNIIYKFLDNIKSSILWQYNNYFPYSLIIVIVSIIIVVLVFYLVWYVRSSRFEGL